MHDKPTDTEFDLSTLKNRGLLDFVVAVAAAQDNPARSLGDLSGLDPLEINIATATALEFGVVRRAETGRLAVTRAGLDWAADKLTPAFGAIFALRDGRAAA